MLADLVEVATPEGIPLSGAYFAPKRGRPLPIDALVFFHGDGGHFYRRIYLDMGLRMAARGLAFLSANRRGHDLVARGIMGGPLKGYAFEAVEESRADFAAWLALLRRQGHRRIAIGGHSGGAVRAVYAQATQRFADVVAVVAVSPGEYNHQTLLSLHGKAFASPYREAEKHLAEGRPDAFLIPGIPFNAVWTARTYVDCFHRDNRYSMVARAGNTACPTLFVFGSEECAPGPHQLPLCGAARRGLEAAGYPNVQVKVIQGANHAYAGRERELLETVFSWLRGL
jgi:dienelactone hydrolase